MLEQLEHMKKWALQDQGALSREQLCQSFAAMCDDAIAELQTVERQIAGDVASCFCQLDPQTGQRLSVFCPVHDTAPSVTALPEPDEMPTHYQDENGDWHDELDDDSYSPSD